MNTLNFQEDEYRAGQHVKILLAAYLRRIVNERKLTQRELAAIVGTSQSRVSNLMSSIPQGVSIEKLITILWTLGYKVDLTVSEENKND